MLGRLMTHVTRLTPKLAVANLILVKVALTKVHLTKKSSNPMRRVPLAFQQLLPDAARIIAGSTLLALIFSGCATPKLQVKILQSSGAASSLVRLTQDEAPEFSPKLSPDGSTLLFSADRYERGLYAGSVLASVDPATGARRTIYTPNSATSMQPSWLPDGTGFVYRSNRSGPWAVVRSLSASPNSGVSVLLDANQAPYIQAPAVGADGRRVAAQALLSGLWSIITLDIGTNQYAVLGEGIHPSFSPDGSRIAFVRTAAGVNQLFTMKAADGTDLVQVTSGQFAVAQPTYSPDGRWIVFASNRSSNSEKPLSNGTWNLFACKVDGSDLTSLTDGTANNATPHWGSNGAIYFCSDQAGNFDLWSLKPEGALLTKQ